MVYTAPNILHQAQLQDIMQEDHVLLMAAEIVISLPVRLPIISVIVLAQAVDVPVVLITPAILPVPGFPLSTLPQPAPMKPIRPSAKSPLTGTTQIQPKTAII